VFWLENNQRRPIQNPAVFESRFRWENIVEISPSEMSGYTIGSTVTYRDGVIIRTIENGSVYILSNQEKRGVSSALAFESLGYKWPNIVNIPVSEATTYADGNLVY
jgi:hypothetical protein